MKCPYCLKNDTDVIDSRESKGNSIRRRRECGSCKRRFTTYEKMDSQVMVIKKDGTRESFSTDKLANGIEKACEKRPISHDTIDSLVRKIEIRAMDRKGSEIKSREIGKMVVGELLKLDPVAYIRFTSVYNKFDSPREFVDAVSAVSKRHGHAAKA